MVDGSRSVGTLEWEDEKEFAKNITRAFAERSLFENGGTASYVHFNSWVVSSGNFTSLEDFNDFVDNDGQRSGGTNIDIGMVEANMLLMGNPSVAMYMFVITDGNANVGDDPTSAAAPNATIFAVGIGEFTAGESEFNKK